MSLDNVMKQVRALLEGAGRTEAEALGAIAMAGRLMAKHGLTLEQIEAAGDNEFRKGGVQAGTGRKAHEVHWCVMSIGGFTGTKSYRDVNKTPVEFVYFGFDQDVTFAEFLTNTIREMMDREWQSYLNSSVRPAHIHGRTLRKSFMIGMAKRINDRLGEMKDQQVREIPTGTSLVIAKNQIVARKFNELGVKLTKSSGTRFHRNSAYGAGQSAGDRVNFSRPVEDNQIRRRIK